MGPNGSGKSTLAQVLAGREDYEVTGGSVSFEGRDLLALPAEERARAGSVPGVPVPGGDSRRQQRVPAEGGAQRQAQGRRRARGRRLRVPGARQAEDEAHADERVVPQPRGVNEGFSGGEKKRNEVLQMLVLEPKLAILDETDSGLDIDALKVVSMGVNSLRDPGRAVVLVTHYQRLLDYIVPDQVHVLSGGRITEVRRPLARARTGAARLRLGEGEPGRMSLYSIPAPRPRGSAALRSFEAQWLARAAGARPAGCAARERHAARAAPRAAHAARRELALHQPAASGGAAASSMRRARRRPRCEPTASLCLARRAETRAATVLMVNGHPDLLPQKMDLEFNGIEISSFTDLSRTDPELVASCGAPVRRRGGALGAAQHGAVHRTGCTCASGPRSRRRW